VPVYLGEDWKFVGFSYLLRHNIIPMICLLSMLIGVWSYMDFKYTTKGTLELAFKITEIENNEYELLAFLTTYIIPLVCFNFESIRHTIVLLILMIVIGVIYIRTNLFYANPILSILKFKVYKVSGIRGDVDDPKVIVHSGKILITKDNLMKGDHVKYVRLDDKIYYAYKTANK
jgi:hypothetical protein